MENDPQQILDFSYAYSRQGNIYAGDTQYSNGNLSPNGLVDSLYGHETNRLYRQSRGLTYNGLWDWGQSKAGVYYEKTNNTRLQEGSTGRVEGMINSEDYATSRLESAYYLGIQCAFLLAGGPDADAGNGMEP